MKLSLKEANLIGLWSGTATVLSIPATGLDLNVVFGPKMFNFPGF